MKKLKIPVFLLIVSIVTAQEVASIDGTIWRRMKQDNKFYFMQGLYEGLQKAEFYLDNNINNARKNDPFFFEPYYLSKTREDIKNFSLKLNQMTVDEMIEALDAFYQNNDYTLIDVTLAMRIILARKQGKIELSDLWLKEAIRQSIGIR